MATSTLMVPKRNGKKIRSMATSNVVISDPTKYVGKVTKKQESLVTGKEIELTGEFNLPLAQTLDEALSLSDGNENDLLFWFNHGRKIAARQQVTQSLGLDFDDEDLKDKYNSFKNALRNMVDEDTPEEKRKAVIDFIGSQDKFKEIKAFMDNFKGEPISVNFAEVELKKPSGVRGRRKKEEGEETEE